MVLGVEQTAADRYDPFDRLPEGSDDRDPAFEPDRHWDLSGSRAVEVEFTPGGTPIRMSEDGNPIRSRRRR